MERLLVMRHAKSDWDQDVPSDFARPLSGRGLTDAPRMGAHIQAQGWTPDVVVASPAARAAMTALLAGSAWGLGSDEVTWDRAIYGGGVQEIMDALTDNPSKGTAMIVGHNPTMEQFVEWLADGPVESTSSGKVMPTASVAAFTLPGGRVAQGAGHLEWLARPKELQA